MEPITLSAGFMVGAALSSIFWYRHEHSARRLENAASGGAKKGLLANSDEPFHQSMTPRVPEVSIDSAHRMWREREQSQDSRAAFDLWADILLTVLGAPLNYPGQGRRLTIAERVEWLQAKMG